MVCKRAEDAVRSFRGGRRMKKMSVQDSDRTPSLDLSQRLRALFPEEGTMRTAIMAILGLFSTLLLWQFVCWALSVPIYLTRKILTFVDGERGLTEIARLAGCHKDAVRLRRDRLGLNIPAANRGQAA
jgi:hypothetical protein